MREQVYSSQNYGDYMHMGSEAYDDFEWEQTPWWNPYRWFGYTWRGWNKHDPWDGGWDYETTRQRAHRGLEQQFARRGN